MRTAALRLVEGDVVQVTMKTWGGKQFWTDVRHAGGWRIQQNVVTANYRLIDPRNVRRVRGTLEVCGQDFARRISTGEMEAPRGNVVVVLHGLVRTTDSMKTLGRYLEQQGGFVSINFEYASSRRPVADHAKALQRLIDSMGSEVRQISFVAHSLGNIVIRRMLGDQIRAHGSCDPRFSRMVMLGPPNQGSRMARLLRYSFLFNLLAGPSGAELGWKWSQLEPSLVIPPFEFGIIAGGQTHPQVFSNFALEGQDDFTVSVQETKLEGATDFLVRPLLHATMMRSRVTLEATLRFLQHGYFLSQSSRNPIEQLNESA